MAWQARKNAGEETQAKTPKVLGKRDTEDLRYSSRPRQRWKTLCKPSTPIHRRGSAKWNDTDTNNKQESVQNKTTVHLTNNHDVGSWCDSLIVMIMMTNNNNNNNNNNIQ